MKRLLLATAVAMLGFAGSVSAAPIITIGQSSNSNTTTAVGSNTGTVITNLNTLVGITQIDNTSPLPGTFPAAFLDLTATSTAAGATVSGTAVVEHFTGTFSITSGSGDTGTNYLSGSFSDAAITSLGSSQITLFAPTASFTSSVIGTLGLPRAIGFTFTNVLPPVGLTACSACASGETIASFGASVGANASANAVPEPTSIALLGVGLLGLGFVAQRKRG